MCPVSDERKDEMRFCPCGYSFKQGDPSDPMTWHKEVGIHQARLWRQRVEANEANIEAGLSAAVEEV